MWAVAAEAFVRVCWIKLPKLLTEHHTCQAAHPTAELIRQRPPQLLVIHSGAASPVDLAFEYQLTRRKKSNLIPNKPLLHRFCNFRRLPIVPIIMIVLMVILILVIIICRLLLIPTLLIDITSPITRSVAIRWPPDFIPLGWKNIWKSGWRFIIIFRLLFRSCRSLITIFYFGKKIDESKILKIWWNSFRYVHD